MSSDEPSCLLRTLLEVLALKLREVPFPLTCELYDDTTFVVAWRGVVGCWVVSLRVECDGHFSSTGTTDPSFRSDIVFRQEARIMGPHPHIHVLDDSLTHTHMSFAPAVVQSASSDPLLCFFSQVCRWLVSCTFRRSPDGAKPNSLLNERSIVAKATA